MRRIQPVLQVLRVLSLILVASAVLLSSGCSGTIAAKDSSGREITLTKRPERIVSLAPSNTEILFALGLGELVKGVTSYCNFPPEAAMKPSVGGFMDYSLEKIVSLKPDLVLATSNQDDAVASLAKMGITVAVLDASTVSEVGDCITLVGNLTGKRREAQALVSEIQRDVKSITEKVSAIPKSQRSKVLYLAWDSPIMTVGPGTLIHELITLAGGNNLASAAREAYPVYSMEMVLVENPDVILIPRVESSLSLEVLRSLPAWNRIAAVKGGRVFLVDDDLVSRPGPRVAQGLREIAKILYPDVFDAKAP